MRGLEESLDVDRPRALIQMATGAGKTFAAVSNSYRLLERARRADPVPGGPRRSRRAGEHQLPHGLRDAR